jgi:hypothetical protein
MDPATKQAALLLWFSIGTLFYLLYLHIDDTNYKEKLKEEQEKEKQEEEWFQKAVGQNPKQPKKKTSVAKQE